MDSTKRRAVTLALFAAPFVGLAPALAEREFPSRPIKIVTGFGPGVGIEVSTRILADQLSKELGQPVIVENKPGAATMIAANQVAQAPKDGYTLLLLNVQQYNNPLLFRNVNYKPSDFVPIALGGTLSLVMVVSKALPVKNAHEFIELARANPGKFNYGYWGVGGSPHLMATRLQAVAGIKMEGVAYRDPGQASTDLAAGRIHLFITSATHGVSMMQAGQANIIAVGTQRRMAKLPETPTFAESGVQGMPSPWWGYGAPAGTPPEVVAKLERAFRAAIATPRYQQMLADTASEPLSFDTLDSLNEFIVQETERWASAIRPLNLKLE
ncbi:tripartite tricarboxylate transporter substrate binding protein [Variovorax sp. J31P207]|uniref:Bug family tripartite tricarboxylate transporter substrate binding protein n=1 Tax=Variovorax sp. J31P207 TaxID=3053510 RepID=UPI0025763A56|nr:tripartite tricarboxylate transporter substrate binding protein [Variovorax sp. J31P207]MDM0069997.1 tripartite tricarboxylate transporter substrate binding protein [Variovorax sp. J31P207]